MRTGSNPWGVVSRSIVEIYSWLSGNFSPLTTIDSMGSLLELSFDAGEGFYASNCTLTTETERERWLSKVIGQDSKLRTIH